MFCTRFVKSHAGHLMDNVKVHNPVLTQPFMLSLEVSEIFFARHTWPQLWEERQRGGGGCDPTHTAFMKHSSTKTALALQYRP